MYVYLCMYVCLSVCMYVSMYVAVDLNSCICKQPLFTNKKNSSRIFRELRLSFAEPMLGNNSFYEDWFITCQITPNYHG